MTHTLYQVDAFTDEPFKGNPAVVCLLAGPEPDVWMQKLAAEMNLSETAFLLPGEVGWDLRWFTPQTEDDLCGHATLASAKVLFENQPILRNDLIKFHTRSGDLLARWVDGKVELDFPVLRFEPMDADSDWVEALGFQPVGSVYSGDYVLFEAEYAQTIYSAQPNMAALKKLPMPEVIITAESDRSEYDFISRFFAPQLGIDEDPVTGSAHCLLAPYWAEKMGKLTFDAYQASQRGGRLTVKIMDDRVRIMGAAQFIFKAELLF